MEMGQGLETLRGLVSHARGMIVCACIIITMSAWNTLTDKGAAHAGAHEGAKGLRAGRGPCRFL